MKVCGQCGAVLVTGGGAWLVALKREGTGGGAGAVSVAFEACSVPCLVALVEKRAASPLFELDSQKNQRKQLKLFS